jgi:hypothetical protein
MVSSGSFVHLKGRVRGFFSTRRFTDFILHILRYGRFSRLPCLVKRIRRESWESVTQLKRAVKDFIQKWNASGCGFRRTKEPEEIIAKIRKAREGIVMHTV